jgi:hypothetical protein
MYQLKEVTVTASVSKNYQKAEVTMTAEIEDQNDLESLKQLVRDNALSLLDTLPVKEEKVEAPVQKPTYTAPKANNTGNRTYQPRPQQNNQPQSEVRMASEKQLAYLRSFGYSGDGNLTFQQADTLLKQYKHEL